METLPLRLRGLFFAPRATWTTIAAENATPSSLYRGWIMWLAAITPISMFVGLAIFGLSLPTIGIVRPGTGALLLQMLVGYVLALVIVYLVALLAAAMSPTFGGRKDHVQALKLVAYAWAPVWVVGALRLIPAITVVASVVGLAALIYSAWLLWAGMQPVLNVPQDRAAGFTALLIVIGAVLAFAVGAAGAAFSGIGGMAPGAAGPFLASHRGGVDSPGSVYPAMGKAGHAPAHLRPTSGPVKAVAPSRLGAFLPATVDGLARGPISTFKRVVPGLQMSSAEAHYGAGAQSLKISITDLVAERAMLALSLAIQKDQETATGYDKIFQQDGNTVTEHWVAGDRYGTYSVIVANRFEVKVVGTGPSMASLQKAAQAVDLAGLTQVH